MMAPFVVGRVSSIAALESALASSEKSIFLAAQKDPKVDEPAAGDIHETGVIASVVQSLKLPNGHIKVMVEGVVLTMYDERTNLAQQVSDELKKYFGEKLCKTTIPRNIRLAEAPSHGQPALVYDVRSRGAESYIRLAKEILDRQAAAASGSSGTSDSGEAA